jgi:hypothetical protein
MNSIPPDYGACRSLSIVDCFVDAQHPAVHSALGRGAILVRGMSKPGLNKVARNSSRSSGAIRPGAKVRLCATPIPGRRFVRLALKAFDRLDLKEAKASLDELA